MLYIIKNQKNRGVTEILVIVIGLLLILVVFGVFTYSGNLSLSSRLLPLRVKCGLTVVSPLPNQKVSFPLLVSGYTNGCGWVPFEAVAGSLRVTDSNNSVLSDNYPLETQGDWTKLPAKFSRSITIKIKPQTKTGFLLFSNDNPSGERQFFYRMPVNF